MIFWLYPKGVRYMGELYQSLGFSENPFSRFSAEEEIDYLSDIYIKPRYFDTLINDLSNGASRFIFGDRGSGKSALIIELKKELEKNNIFAIIIQNYDDIPLKNNDKHMIYLMIQELLKKLVVVLSKNSFLIKKLDKNDKEKLAIFIRDFYNSMSRREYEDSFNKISKVKAKNTIKNIFNTILNKPINIAISSGIEITSDLVCKSFNLPKTGNLDFYKKYIPDLKLEEINKKQKEEYFLSNYKLLKDMLLELIFIIKKLGFKNTVIFFDRIDEFKALGGKINNIVDFTVQMLKDTDLLYTKELSLVFSIWNDIKRKLNEDGIRFDKFKPIDVSWNNEDTINILQKRLAHFAINKPYDYKNLLEKEECLEDLIYLVNKSPRDLIRLFSAIYDEQSISNPQSKVFQMDNIHKAEIKYCRQYDYYSVFPSKIGTKEDIVSIVKKILKVGKTTFKSSDLVSEFKFSTQSANSYIKIMKDYGLICDNEQIVSVPKEYIVIDPKLVYLIDNSIKELK